MLNDNQIIRLIFGFKVRYLRQQKDFSYQQLAKKTGLSTSYLNDIEKALVFLYLEDKNYKEISETMGITEVNARVKMNRVKGKLKKILLPHFT